MELKHRVLYLLLVGFQVLEAKSCKVLTANFEISAQENIAKCNMAKSNDFDKKFLETCRFLYEKNKPSNMYVTREEELVHTGVELSEENKIPKIIHKIWVGKKPIPSLYKELTRSWLENHPDWKCILWTDKDVDGMELYNRKYYDLTASVVEKANILRYEVLWKFGGLYVDMDAICLQPFDDLHKFYDFYACMEPVRSKLRGVEKIIINNAIIGCKPGHPVIEHCIKTMTHDWHYESVFERSGTIHFSKSIAESVQDAPGVNILLPPTYFYPFFRVDRNSIKLAAEALNELVKPETMTIHYYNSLNNIEVVDTAINIVLKKAGLRGE